MRGQVWLTETGGIVKFVLPSGGKLFPFSESRANKATKRMFALAKRYRSRIKRLYIYNWQQPRGRQPLRRRAHAPRTAQPRPAYRTVRSARCGTRIFNP